MSPFARPWSSFTRFIHRKSRPIRRSVALHCERLEDRCVPSVSPFDSALASPFVDDVFGDTAAARRVAHDSNLDDSSANQRANIAATPSTGSLLEEAGGVISLGANSQANFSGLPSAGSAGGSGPGARSANFKMPGFGNFSIPPSADPGIEPGPSPIAPPAATAFNPQPVPIIPTTGSVTLNSFNTSVTGVVSFNDGTLQGSEDVFLSQFKMTFTSNSGRPQAFSRSAST